MKIIKLVPKTWNDKQFYDAEVEDQGKVVKASIWPPFPPNLAEGAEVVGSIVQNTKGFNTVKFSPMGPRPGWAGKKSEEIRQAQERKAHDIEKAQDRKEMSIAYFNSVNNAIQLTLGLYQLQRTAPIATEVWNEITRFRDLFYSEWQKWDAQDITDKTIPFNS